MKHNDHAREPAQAREGRRARVRLRNPQEREEAHEDAPVETPDDGCPARAVPQAGEEHGEEQIPAGHGNSAAAASDGEVDVIAKPGGEADVPAPPEVARADGKVGQAEVDDELEPEEFRDAARDGGVAG